MGVPKYAVPSRLSLTAEERAAYRRLADALLQSALKDYAAFSVDNPARRVSSLDWKLIKSQDGISVYKERHPPTSRKDTPFAPRLLTADGRYERVESNISVPHILVTGAMHGTVDDAIHGAFVDGPETHATRGYYIQDRSSDFRVLARVDEPTESDPHRFCGLAWTEMGGAGVPFVKRRDLFTLVTSGSVTMADSGERIGYYIIHSISHPLMPPLTEHKMLRAKCSFSYLFSQQHQHGVAGGVGSQVETFQKGFFAPLGDVPERSVVSAVVRTLICPSRLVDAGYNRKLTFLVQHAPPGRSKRTKSRAGSRDDFASEDGHDSDDDDDGCAGGCARRRSDSFFSSSGGAPFSSSGGPLRKLTQQSQSHGVCVICKLKVCASCKVVKKMVVEAQGYELEIKPLGFCLVCVNKAKMLSAPMLARQELVEKRTSGSAAGSSPLPPRTPDGAHLSPCPNSNSRTPPIEKPRVLRKSSWTASEASSARSTPTSDEMYGTRARVALEKPRVERKTSWSVGETLPGKTTITSDDVGYAIRMRAAMDKPRVERKTSWTGSAASSGRAPVNGDGMYGARMRAAMEHPRIEQKTSWGGAGTTSMKTISISSGDAGYQARMRAAMEKPRPERKTSWVGGEVTASSSSLSADEASSVKKTRPPPPPLPSRWSPQPSPLVSSPPQPVPKAPSSGSAAAESAPRKRAPPPERPQRQPWQPSVSGGTSTAARAPEPVRTERKDASPTSGVYLLPTTQDKPAPAATQSRRRIDERVAIEDIALHGILL